MKVIISREIKNYLKKSIYWIGMPKMHIDGGIRFKILSDRKPADGAVPAGCL